MGAWIESRCPLRLSLRDRIFTKGPNVALSSNRKRCAHGFVESNPCQSTQHTRLLHQSLPQYRAVPYSRPCSLQSIPFLPLRCHLYPRTNRTVCNSHTSPPHSPPAGRNARASARAAELYTVGRAGVVAGLAAREEAPSCLGKVRACVGFPRGCCPLGDIGARGEGWWHCLIGGPGGGRAKEKMNGIRRCANIWRVACQWARRVQSEWFSVRFGK
jgi:hypothetical protein